MLAHFTELQLNILRVVVAWLNRQPVKINDTEYSIGESKEPDLRSLMVARDLDTSGYKDALEDLRDFNILEDRWVCRRKVNWALTEYGYNLVNTHIDAPSWIYHPRFSATEPLLGVSTDRLLVRKGYWAVRNLALEWPEIKSIGFQPTDHVHLSLNRPNNRPDCGVISHAATNNTRQLKLRYNKASSFPNLPFIWVFDGRETMVESINHLHRDDNTEFSVYGGALTGRPRNWAAKSVNDRLDESEGDGMTAVTTMTSMIDGERDDLIDLLI